MRNMNLGDTIAAISTSMGESGIGIVRLSGPEALKAADKLFRAKGQEQASGFKTYTIHYGWVVDGKGDVVDEAILSLMRAPRSYTKEDVAEISCHGGVVALRRVLELALENGCRLAEPGEFTRRAFLNGRIDLAQAEAVLDIIRAKSDSALKLGEEQLRGGLSKQISDVRDALLDVLVPLEASIDFPDEGLDAYGTEKLTAELRGIQGQVSDMLTSAKYGRVLREGVRMVICGRPNVGKSSLLNALLKQERSIVTSVPGTTRDTVEEIIDIKGIPVRIVDTAGILEPRDLVEKKAIQRSREQIRLADLVILVFDASQKLAKDDLALISRLKKKKVLAVLNKIDMKQKIDKGYILKKFVSPVEISAKKSRNIGLLENALAGSVYSGQVNIPEPLFVSNLRHIQMLEKAEKLIARAADSLDNKLSPEFAAQDLKDAVGYIDEISGKKFSQDLLDRIFSEFCIGK